MKKILFLLVSIIGCYSCLHAQNPIWSLPPNYKIGNQTFPLPINSNTSQNNPNSPIDYYDGAAPQGSSNAMLDVNNDLLFFVVDGFIYNNTGEFIAHAWDPYVMNGNNLTGSYNHASSPMIYNFKIREEYQYPGQETVIVPHPVNCHQYYIFGSMNDKDYIDGQYGNWGYFSSIPYYCLYDAQTQTVIQSGPWFNDPTDMYYSYVPQGTTPIFTPNSTSNPANTNGDPQVTTDEWKSESIINGGLSIGASKLRTDGTRFVTCYMKTKLYIIQIDATGNLHYWKRHFNPGADIYGENKQAELELVFDSHINGYHLATSCSGPSSRLFLCNLSSDMLTMTGYQNIDMPVVGSGSHPLSIHGLEFSPSNLILYFTTAYNPISPPPLPNSFNALNYVDFTFGIPSSFGTIPGSNLFQNSFLELAGDNKIYAATPTGLYSISNTNSPTAVSISSGVTLSTPIAASYCGDYIYPSYILKNYVLPDQIDGMDYTAHFKQTVKCCLENTDYQIRLYNVTGTAVWNDASDITGLSLSGNTVTVRDELRIKAGTDITINNMIFKFAPGARVVIEPGSGSTPGGKLTLDNTTFTNDVQCTSNIYWLGVEVQGDGTASQLPINTNVQGKFYVKNNSVIEHAQIGAVAGRRRIEIPPTIDNLVMLTAQFTPTGGGGIIKAVNSTFQNNFVDVQFEPYAYPNNNYGGHLNVSKFTNCLFTTTEATIPYPILSVGTTHAKLIKTKGVTFVSCDFTNTTTTTASVIFPSIRGAGIVGQNSYFSVTSDNCFPPCNNFNRGTFSGLEFGIRAFSTGFPTVKINAQDFTDNYYGINLSGADAATITNNNFKVKIAFSLSGSSSTYGLYLNASSTFHVENNYFTAYNATPTFMGNTYGIVVNNSGVAHNEIYRNTFEKIKVGTQAQGTNASPSYNTIALPIFAHTKGLQFKCNHYLKPVQTADIAVTSGTIDPNQGHFYFNFPYPDIQVAGNRFSHSGSGAYDFFADPGVNGNIGINYIHTSDGTSTPNVYSSQVHPISIGQPYNAKTCPSKIFGGVIVSSPSSYSNIQAGLRKKVDSLKIEISASKSLIDGGNTSDLLSAIASQSPGQIKNTLMNASPYLSDTVLITYLNQNPPNGHVKQVVVANSPVTPPVYQKVLDMNLPHGIQKQIDNAQEGISERRMLENKITFLSNERTDVLYERIRQFIFDTISPAPFDSIALILKTENIPISNNKRLFDTYCQMNDSINASITKSAIQQEGSTDNFLALADVKIQLMACPSVCHIVHNDSTLLDKIQSVAYDPSDRINGVKAQCLLVMLYDSTFYPVVEPMNIPTNTAIAQNNGSNGMLGAQETASNINIYPNPSEGTQKINVQLISEDKTLVNSHIEIYNLAGQLMYQADFRGKGKTISFDASVLHQGIYFVKLISENAVVEIKKLLINQ